MNTAATMDIDMSNKRVLVAGLGVSGRAAVESLLGRVSSIATFDEHVSADQSVTMLTDHTTADVSREKLTVADNCEGSQSSTTQPSTMQHPNTCITHYQDPSLIDWQQFDLVVVSPGFPPSTPWLIEAQAHGVQVVSEVQIAAWLNAHCPWIAITGTNGKTTTTSMVSAMLAACGLQAPAVGNIGTPITQASLDSVNDVLCVELSSFQLHFTDTMPLTSAVILNLADDHLDWHGGFDNYAADKATIYRSVTKGLVYNADDPVVTRLALQTQVRDGVEMVGFTLGDPVAGQIGIRDGWVVDARHSIIDTDNMDQGVHSSQGGHSTQGGHSCHGRKLFAVDNLRCYRNAQGHMYPHLLADALAATALVLTHGVSRTQECQALQALQSFVAGDHRITTVAEVQVDGGIVSFVDDSKATNAHAAAASLDSFDSHSIIWVVGGLAKGAVFDQLVAEHAHRVKSAIIIGHDRAAWHHAFQSAGIRAIDIDVNGECEAIRRLSVDQSEGSTSADKKILGQLVMNQVVREALRIAEPEDVVLLAPACASMDQFVSYAHRGQCFADASRQAAKE